jgi:hypothetical protein
MIYNISAQYSFSSIKGIPNLFFTTYTTKVNNTKILWYGNRRRNLFNKLINPLNLIQQLNDL